MRRIIGRKGFVRKNERTPTVVYSETDDLFYFFVTVNHKNIILSIIIRTEGIGNKYWAGLIDRNGGGIRGSATVMIGDDQLIIGCKIWNGKA